MSNERKSGLSRRPIVVAILGAFGLGTLGLVAYETPSLFRPRYRRTAFDELLVKLADRDNANRLGAAVLAQTRNFNATLTFRELRTRMAGKSLMQALDDDLAGDRMTIVQGWALPETLTKLCALSAKVSYNAR